MVLNNKKEYVQLGLIILFFFSIEIPGLKWGLPDKKIKNLYFSTDNEIKEFISNVGTEYVEKSWEISKTEDISNKLQRAIFNPIRSFHPDEEIILKSISNMKPQNLNFNPHFFEYPSLYIYLIALNLFICSIFGIIHLEKNLLYYFLNPGEMAKLYLVGRITTLLFSLLCIIFLFLATSELFKNKKIGIISSLILTLNPLFVLNSHYLTVDIPMVFFGILTAYFCVKYYKEEKIMWIYFASISAGLSAATKYPGLAFWFVIPTILLYQKDKEKVKHILISFFIFIMIFLLTNPYIMLSFNEFKNDFLERVIMRRGVGVNFLSSILMNFKNLFFALKISTTNLFFILIISALLFAFWNFNKKELKIPFLFIIFFCLPLFLSSGFKYGRYYLPLFPFLSMIIGFTIYNISYYFKHKVVITLIFSIFLTHILIKGIAYGKNMSEKDIRIISGEYISNNIKSSSTIVFTKSPWIFEVPPVNLFRYNVLIVDENNLKEVEKGSYLILGELQYFLTSGSRDKLEKEIISEMENYGFYLKKVFVKDPEVFNIKFDTNIIIHDMLYTHPKIFLFQKYE